MKRLALVLLFLATPLHATVRDVASASTITLHGSGVYRVTGVANISTILGLSDGDEITILPSGAFTFDALGNINALSSPATVDRPILMVKINGTIFEQGPSVGGGGGGGAGAPATALYIVQQPDATLVGEQALSLLGTGIMKSTTGFGTVSIAVAGTDYYNPGGTDVAISDGGTGQSTAVLGFNALSPITSKGDVLSNDGTNDVRLAVGSNGDVLTADSTTASGLKFAAPAGGGASIADNGAFTFGTTLIGPTGFVVDDVATNAVTENSMGAPRMTASRIIYVDLSKTAANTSKILVTPDSVALPANQSVNVAQLAGTTTDTNSGVKSAGTLRVVLATDQPQLTNKLLVTPDSVALPANQSVNMAQIGGTNTVTAGVSGLLAIGGNVANAGTATANPVPVGGVFVTAPATLTTGQTATLQFTAAQNAKHDLTTIAGTAPTTAGKIDVKGADGDVFVRQATGTNLHAVLDTTSTTAVTQATAANLNATVVQGTAAAAAGGWPVKVTDGTNTAAVKAASTGAVVGDPAMVVSISPNTAAIVITAVTGGTAGTLGIGGTAANNAAITQNPDLIGVEALSSQPAAATTGNQRRLVGTLDGRLYVQQGGPVPWSCGLTAIGATLTQCQAAPTAGLKLYVTDIHVGSNTATGGQFTLRYGTGAACVTGTTTVFPNIAATTTGVMPYPGNTASLANINFTTPISAAAANAVCVICVVTNTCVINIAGFTAP